MKQRFTTTTCFFLLLVFGMHFAGVQRTQGQERASKRVPAEYESVVSAVQKVMGLLQDVTQRHATDPINDQIMSISDRLTLAGPVTGGFRNTVPDEDLIEMLHDIERELESIARALDRRGEDDLSRRLSSVLADLEDVIEEAGEDDVRIRRSNSRRYEIRKGRERVTINTRDDDWWDDDDEWEDEKDRWRNAGRDWRRSGMGWHSSASTYVGELSHRWPYQANGLYRNIPGFRYNRVEGFFLGFARAPLEWSSWDRGRIYGQAGYAFGLEDWRYSVGAETRLGHARRNNNFDVKIGGSYHLNTGTDDLWKSSWAENSSASALFRHDFFDYYQTEGWTAYLVGRVTPYAQFSAGYRADEYTSLENNADWSLFGGNDFRLNPAIQEGEMRSFVFALEGGKVSSFNHRPNGAAFRLEAELGQGLGGDFDYSRFLGDIRTYTRITRESGLNLRFRGGFTEGTVPVQKAFTLGGIGSVRGYNQNEFIGTRMMLANAELALYQPDVLDWLLDDITLFGTFDAGWTNLTAGQNEFSTDDVFSSAGFGIAFDDRTVRLEVSWPLRDLGTGYQPSIWFRINPTF